VNPFFTGRSLTSSLAALLATSLATQALSNANPLTGEGGQNALKSYYQSNDFSFN